MFKRQAHDHQKKHMEGVHNAKRYLEKVRSYSEERYSAFFKRMDDLSPRGKLLEVGSGPGNLSVLVSRRYPKTDITALEVSSDMVNVGKEYLANYPEKSRIEFVLGDVCNEADMNNPGSYDLIYSAYALHHWHDPEAALRNMVKALNPGGVCYILDFRRIWCAYFPLFFKGPIHAMKASFTARELRVMVEKMGISNYQLIKESPPYMQSLIIRK